MILPDSHSSRVAPETWQRYLKASLNQKVIQSARPWYARRVEAYLKAVCERPVERHSDRDVAAYLETLGRSGSLRDWQYAQAVKALRIFFTDAVRAGWAGTMDWEYWKDSARQLEADHATVAREMPVRGELTVTPQLGADTDLGNESASDSCRDSPASLASARRLHQAWHR